MTDDRNPRAGVVVADTAALAVYERGRPAPDRPTVVLAHGWPDSHEVWDPVAERLADRFHVVTYDMRGVGASTPGLVHRPYALDKLAGDLRAVMDAVCPDRPVHVVGHDWGSVVGWELVMTAGHAGRVASFTSLSGPNLDFTGDLLRRRLRRPTAAGLAPLLGQMVKSGYTILLSVPGISTQMWRVGAARLFRMWLKLSEGVTGYPGPGLPHDAMAAVGLYRTNIVPRILHPDLRPVSVPVHLVVATADRYVSAPLTRELATWLADPEVSEVPAGHWSPRSHPGELTALICGFIRTAGQRPDHRRDRRAEPRPAYLAQAPGLA